MNGSIDTDRHNIEKTAQKKDVGSRESFLFCFSVLFFFLDITNSSVLTGSRKRGSGSREEAKDTGKNRELNYGIFQIKRQR